ncbi:hypothetical protein ILUMI_05420 [Ignelater luminosus]|uniref:Uncharacterized protein n=1 Tax=Ignelater luminosus TaxID=2038154 RepID=A0A8K0DBZ0_IGNLU|nr:hypothetical protein ILUMI_05420 [Ignelater luminosus]
MVRNWLKEKIADCIAKEDCASASPDLNPLDYDLWSKLELDVYSKRHTSLESPKQSFVKKWDGFSQEKRTHSSPFDVFFGQTLEKTRPRTPLSGQLVSLIDIRNEGVASLYNSPLKLKPNQVGV